MECFEISCTVRILVRTQILITFATTKHLIISLKAKQLINRVDIDGNRVDFNNRVDQTLFEDQGKKHFLPDYETFKTHFKFKKNKQSRIKQKCLNVLGNI